MSVAHGSHNAIVQTRESVFGTGRPVSISYRPRSRTAGSGHVPARRTAALPDDQVFNATAVWRGRNLEGYLERKLHRQWRNRGS